jgi:hypothetical protein
MHSTGGHRHDGLKGDTDRADANRVAQFTLQLGVINHRLFHARFEEHDAAAVLRLAAIHRDVSAADHRFGIAVVLGAGDVHADGHSDEHRPAVNLDSLFDLLDHSQSER